MMASLSKNRNGSENRLARALILMTQMGDLGRASCSRSSPPTHVAPRLLATHDTPFFGTLALRVSGSGRFVLSAQGRSSVRARAVEYQIRTTNLWDATSHPAVMRWTIFDSFCAQIVGRTRSTRGSYGTFLSTRNRRHVPSTLQARP